MPTARQQSWSVIRNDHQMIMSSSSVCPSVRLSACNAPHSACAAHLKLTLHLLVSTSRRLYFNFCMLTCLSTANFAFKASVCPSLLSVTLGVAVKTTHLTAKVYTTSTFNHYTFLPIATMVVVCLSVRPSVCDTPHSARAAHLKLTLHLLVSTSRRLYV